MFIIFENEYMYNEKYVQICASAYLFHEIANIAQIKSNSLDNGHDDDYSNNNNFVQCRQIVILLKNFTTS